MFNMKRTLLVILATVSAFTFGGCQTGGAYLPQNADKHAYENAENFVLMDKGAQRSITSPGIQQTVLPDGRLKVAAQIRNREGRRIQVQVQCEFKDAQGFTIDSTPWNTLILTERAQETVTFVSMNDQAKRYTIRVREAR